MEEWMDSYLVWLVSLFLANLGQERAGLRCNPSCDLDDRDQDRNPPKRINTYLDQIGHIPCSRPGDLAEVHRGGSGGLFK